MGLFTKILGDGDETSDRANPRTVREDGDVIVEMTNDGSVYLPSEEVHFDLDNRRMFVNGNLVDVSGLAPTDVHLPVENMTAANNLEEKSEHCARMPTEVVRYSKVVNPSNDPDLNVSLNVPYVEIWF